MIRIDSQEVTFSAGAGCGRELLAEIARREAEGWEVKHNRYTDESGIYWDSNGSSVTMTWEAPRSAPQDEDSIAEDASCEDCAQDPDGLCVICAERDAAAAQDDND